MITSCCRILFLLAWLFSVQGSAQTIQAISPKTILPKAASKAVLVTEYDDSLGRMSCYALYTDRRIHEPLFVIDGIVSSNEELKRIDTQKIENIVVIKEDRATRLYGQHGINGVIVITTKKHSANKKKEKGYLD